MITDRYGRVSITEQEAFDALYTGKLKSLDSVTIDDNLDQYNVARTQNADRIPELFPQADLTNISQELFDKAIEQMIKYDYIKYENNMVLKIVP